MVPGWVTGADTLFDEVLDQAPWKAYERPMYDRIVDVPRLATHSWPHPPPVVDQMARCLGRRYGVALPSISANLYRDGRDSVAWHGDRIGRHRVDSIVAILSLGDTRTLLLRPDGGGPSTVVRAARRRPAGAGRHLSAHLRALRAQASPRRPADQRDVPPAGWELTYRRRP